MKCDICAFAITIARPLTNPRLTGYGTRRMNLPPFRSPEGGKGGRSEVWKVARDMEVSVLAWW